MGRGWCCLQGSDGGFPICLDFPEEFTAMLREIILGEGGQGLSEGPGQPQPLWRCLNPQLL